MANPKAKQRSAPSSLTTAVLETYTSALNRYMARRLRRGQDAGDMVQEVFERFLRKKDRPQVLRNPFGYLLGFARNVLLENLGDERNSPVVYNSDLVDGITENQEDPSLESMEDRLGHRQEMLEALSKLPEAHQLALTLVDGQGMSYEEAAKVSGFTKSTVATYVMQARATLRLLLPSHWSDSVS